MTDKPQILHLSFDYSEENIGKSTVVVSDLITATKDFSEPSVISLKRTANPAQENISVKRENLVSFNAFGLPYALFLKNNMKRIASRIIQLINKSIALFNKFSIIHSHKLTYEGFIGYYLAKESNTPLFISLRQTDFHVLKYRPDLKNFCTEILIYASTIFYIAPYMKESLKKIFGEEFYDKHLTEKLIYLPNSIDTSHFYKTGDIFKDRFLTILWLNKKALKRKNLYNLFKALASLKDKSIKLDIIGHGNAEELVKKWTEKLDIIDQVRFLGFVRNDEIPGHLSSYKGFLMPSHSETFGVAYAEALLSGTPIMFTKGTGFDGSFDDVGVAVNSRSVRSIAEGIMKMNSDYEKFRRNINDLKNKGSFTIFSRESIKETYKDAVLRISNNS